MKHNKNLQKIKGYIMNEGYQDKEFFFRSGKGSKIFTSKKKYIDLSFCGGSLILGHNSKIYQSSIKKLIKDKITNFASPNEQAEKYSLVLKKKFPNFSKFIFCNSGSEAVLKTLRICKAITNKKIIFAVSGSWHGSVDKLLYNADKRLKPKNLSDGLSDYNKKNLKFIPYNNIKTSKKILDKYKNKASCIIIEPIQGCLPTDKAKEYLMFLSSFAKKNNIILIFDEMITGLRTDSRSVQSYFKFNSDITTFGKCFGGGFPIGIIGISKKVENKIYMKNKKIYFGGTFSGNSISTYIGKLTTQYIERNKKQIFENLEKKSSFFEKEINSFISDNNVNAYLYRFKSILRLVFTKKKVTNRYQRDFFEYKNLKNIKNFRYFLLKNGVNYPSNGIIYMSASTSYADLKIIIKLFKKGLKKFIN